jgi:Acetyltransferase (GNAT) domain
MELSTAQIAATRDQSIIVRTTSELSDELLRVDRLIFGGDRASLLRRLVRSEQTACYVVDEGGRAGFLISGARLVGPGCATDADVARALV